MFTAIKNTIRKFPARKDRMTECHYCARPVSFKERHANHILFACDDCKEPKVETKKNFNNRAE